MKILDLSKEFNHMDPEVFRKSLKTLIRENSDQIKIIIVSDNIETAKRLKALNEDHFFANKINFDLTIETTIENYQKELNAFASGIKRKQI